MNLQPRHRPLDTFLCEVMVPLSPPGEFPDPSHTLLGYDLLSVMTSLLEHRLDPFGRVEREKLAFINGRRMRK